jgi:hypothetical protein
VKHKFLFRGPGFDVVTLQVLKLALPTKSTGKDTGFEIPHLLKTRQESRNMLDRLDVPMLETGLFKLSQESAKANLKISLRASGDKPVAKPKKEKGKSKVKAAPKVKASTTAAADPSMMEFTVGFGGQLRKTRLIDDVVNAVCHSIERVDAQAVDFDFVCNMMLLCIVFALNGEVCVPKKDEDSCFARRGVTHGNFGGSLMLAIRPPTQQAKLP